MQARAHLHVTITWIPGHQEIEGNERGYALTRENSSPGALILWSKSYDPYIRRRQLHDQRTHALLQLQQTVTVPSPSKLKRADAISGDLNTPKGPICEAYSRNLHELWVCAAAQPLLRKHISTPPPHTHTHLTPILRGGSTLPPQTTEGITLV